MISVRCAECQCVQQDCINVNMQNCVLCTKDVCCCSNIHNRKLPLKNSLAMAKVIRATDRLDNCCTSGTCENNKNALKRNLATKSHSPSSSSYLSYFFRSIKG